MFQKIGIIGVWPLGSSNLLPYVNIIQGLVQVVQVLVDKIHNFEYF